jgi:hypothetical protein
VVRRQKEFGGKGCATRPATVRSGTNLGNLKQRIICDGSISEWIQTDASGAELAGSLRLGANHDYAFNLQKKLLACD